MSATVGGAVPTPPNNTTTFLRGDATWGVPAGSGGGASDITVATIAALKALNVATLTDGQALFVRGYYADNDGGGGGFYYKSGSSTADDGGAVIQPTAGSGRFIRIWSSLVRFPVRAWGAKASNSSGDATTNTTAIDAAIAYLTGSSLPHTAGTETYILDFADGNYYSNGHKLPNNTIIFSGSTSGSCRWIHADGNFKPLIYWTGGVYLTAVPWGGIHRINLKAGNNTFPAIMYFDTSIDNQTDFDELTVAGTSTGTGGAQKCDGFSIPYYLNLKMNRFRADSIGGYAMRVRGSTTVANKTFATITPAMFTTAIANGATGVIPIGNSSNVQFPTLPFGTAILMWNAAAGVMPTVGDGGAALLDTQGGGMYFAGKGTDQNNLVLYRTQANAIAGTSPITYTVTSTGNIVIASFMAAFNVASVSAAADTFTYTNDKNIIVASPTLESARATVYGSGQQNPITVGTTPSSYTAGIDNGSGSAGTVLTVTAMTSGTLCVGQTVAGAGITGGTTITALGTGRGGIGTYTVSASQLIASEAMTGTTGNGAGSLHAVFLYSDGTMPGGLVAGVAYFPIYVDAQTCQFATTPANAIAGTAINITSAGTGNITMVYDHQIGSLGIGGLQIAGSTWNMGGAATAETINSVACGGLGFLYADFSYISYEGAIVIDGNRFEINGAMARDTVFGSSKIAVVRVECGSNPSVIGPNGIGVSIKDMALDVAVGIKGEMYRIVANRGNADLAPDFENCILQGMGSAYNNDNGTARSMTVPIGTNGNRQWLAQVKGGKNASTAATPYRLDGMAQSASQGRQSGLLAAAQQSSSISKNGDLLASSDTGVAFYAATQATTGWCKGTGATSAGTVTGTTGAGATFTLSTVSGLNVGIGTAVSIPGAGAAAAALVGVIKSVDNLSATPTFVLGNAVTGADLPCLTNVTAVTMTFMPSTWASVREYYTVSATLDFPSVAANTTSDLTIAAPTNVTFRDGAQCIVGVKIAAISAGISYTAFVTSGGASVTVRCTNCTVGAVNPASAVFNVDVAV